MNQTNKLAAIYKDGIGTLKEFNNSDSDNFYYDKDNLVFTSDGCKIKNE